MAAYDDSEQIGMLRWIGLVVDRAGKTVTVDWKQATAQIWVDTPTGRGRWRSGSFGFAPKKIGDYGLHELWQQHFDHLELRDHTAMTSRPRGSAGARSTRIAPERLNPVEVIGQQTSGSLAGVVYVLKSAYGYKIGRTRSVPDRMRTFGVRLPFVYSIPLCVWFENCHAAERRFHEMFSTKRINGEWFDLDADDIDQVRAAAPQA